MKVIKKFTIGSKVFFSSINEFIPHDDDTLCIMDEWELQNTNVLRSYKDKQDTFYFKNMSLQEFIDDTLNCNTPMRAGKFLVPEFAQYLNMTIDDLKKLKPLFDKIDNKHKYEKIIYESYIENDGFYLTKKQIQKAYDEYKQYR